MKNMCNWEIGDVNGDKEPSVRVYSFPHRKKYANNMTDNEQHYVAR